MNNKEMFDKYVIVRDMLEEYVQNINSNYENIDFMLHLNYRLTSSSLFSNLNLIYFENRINTLHDLDPTERLQNQAKDIFFDIPDFIKKYDEKLEPFKKK